jgi:hypothetical protein
VHALKKTLFSTVWIDFERKWGRLGNGCSIAPGTKTGSDFGGAALGHIFDSGFPVVQFRL